MLDILFEIVIFLFTGVLAVLPLFSLAATFYLIRLYRNSRPPNEVLKTAAITSSLVTIGGVWWAFVALRRIFVGPDAAALPEVFLLMYAISLVMILSTPLIKVYYLVKLMRKPITEEQIADMQRLEYDLIRRNPTVNEAEDLKFGTERRALEQEHLDEAAKVDKG